MRNLTLIAVTIGCAFACAALNRCGRDESTLWGGWDAVKRSRNEAPPVVHRAIKPSKPLRSTAPLPLDRRDTVLFQLAHTDAEAAALAETSAEADIAVDELRAKFLRDVMQGNADVDTFIDSVMDVRGEELDGYRETLGPERAEELEAELSEP